MKIKVQATSTAAKAAKKREKLTKKKPLYFSNQSFQKGVYCCIWHYNLPAAATSLIKKVYWGECRDMYYRGIVF